MLWVKEVRAWVPLAFAEPRAKEETEIDKSCVLISKSYLSNHNTKVFTFLFTSTHS